MHGGKGAVALAAGEAVAPVEPSKPIPSVLVTGTVVAADLVAVGIAAIVPYLIYLHGMVGRVGGIDTRYVAALAIGIVGAAVIFRQFGVYKEDSLFSDEVPIGRVLLAWATTFAVLLAFAFALKITAFYSRIWAGSWFMGGLAVLAVERAVLANMFRRWAREGRLAQRTVIVGAGPIGARLAAYLDRHGDQRTRIIGFIDDRKSRTPSSVEGYPVIGDTGDLIQMIRAEKVDQVLVSLPWSADDRLHELIRDLAVLPVHIRLAPDLAGYRFPYREVSHTSGLPMLNVFSRPISGWSYGVKTVEDRVLGAMILILLGPLMLMTAIAVKLDSPGPVLFRQKRYGYNNKPIEVYKFRTMRQELSDANCEAQTIKEDPRVTRVGRFLRMSSLDELPQIFNVLRGEMSIVGPRPHATATKAAGRLFEEVVAEYASRHRVKPGITGWAQVNGWRGETDTEEKIRKRVEHDLYYIENWSVWLDLLILLRTVTVPFERDNAY